MSAATVYKPGDTLFEVDPSGILRDFEVILVGEDSVLCDEAGNHRQIVVIFDGKYLAETAEEFDARFSRAPADAWAKFRKIRNELNDVPPLPKRGAK